MKYFAIFAYPCTLHYIFGFRKRPLTDQRAREILAKHNWRQYA